MRKGISITTLQYVASFFAHFSDTWAHSDCIHHLVLTQLFSFL